MKRENTARPLVLWYVGNANRTPLYAVLRDDKGWSVVEFWDDAQDFLDDYDKDEGPDCMRRGWKHHAITDLHYLVMSREKQVYHSLGGAIQRRDFTSVRGVMLPGDIYEALRLKFKVPMAELDAYNDAVNGLRLHKQSPLQRKLRKHPPICAVCAVFFADKKPTQKAVMAAMEHVRESGHTVILTRSKNAVILAPEVKR